MREAAFREIIRKARGGVVGAMIGAMVMFVIACAHHRWNPDYALCLSTGVLGGGIPALIFSGSKIGTIGSWVLFGSAVGGIVALAVVSSFPSCSCGPSPWMAATASFIAVICLAFTGGAAVELHQSK